MPHKSKRRPLDVHGVSSPDLPVAQPAKFEFLISLRVAKALGTNAPAAMLTRADEVIE
jgi:putative tryptophan/tyrosine transport system substrate-binding protein